MSAEQVLQTQRVLSPQQRSEKIANALEKIQAFSNVNLSETRRERVQEVTQRLNTRKAEIDSILPQLTANEASSETTEREYQEGIIALPVYLTFRSAHDEERTKILSTIPYSIHNQLPPQPREASELKEGKKTKSKTKKTKSTETDRKTAEQEKSAEQGRPMKIGIIIPLGDLEQSGEPLSYPEIRGRAQRAEALGFDSLWVYDHLLHRFPEVSTVGFRESWTILSALAEATNKLELGTQVLCTAFRNPALLAKMADTLEEVSNGRLILGVGAGWHQPEFDAFGFPYDHLASRFEEALQIVTPLLRDGHVDFKGKYYEANDCELKPHSTRRPGGPPVMVASFGPRLTRAAAQYAQSWTTDWLGPEEQVLARKKALEDACQEVGRDPKTLELTGAVTVAFPKLGDLPSWMKGPDQYIGGTPEEIADAFRKYQELGVSHIMINYYPNTHEALEELGKALQAFKTE